MGFLDSSPGSTTNSEFGQTALLHLSVSWSPHLLNGKVSILPTLSGIHLDKMR